MIKFYIGLLLLLSTYAYSQSPCPGLDSINYNNQWYHTVQIGSQCWLKENLNIGTEISDGVNQSNNDTIEKYCDGNDPANCAIYGGLLQWREAVQYTQQSTPRGICPIGWHIPSISDFTTLVSSVGGDGNALKQVGQGGGTNTSGFSALLINGDAYFWSSDNYLDYVGNNGSYYLVGGFFYLRTGPVIYVGGRPGGKGVGNPMSIRCLKDSAGLLLRSPIGSESWVVGSKHKISWGGNLTDKKIKIDYSTNDGLSWHQILDTTPAADGDYYWTIPNTPAQYKVKITDLNNPNSFAMSNNFAVYSDLCPADSIIHFGDHNYHTMPIAGRCWLKENVNEGIRIPGSQEQTVNGILEKYCYNDDTANCTTYGGLYKATETGEPGICPSGWHISYSNAFDDLLSLVLYDGNALKAVGQGAGGGTGTNTSGFSLLLAGTRNSDGTFSDLGNQTWIQHIFGIYASSEIMYIRDDYHGDLVGSVRCVRDEALGVTSPYGGELWQVGSVHKITWGYANVQNISIDYSIDNEVTWINLVSSIPITDSSYNWTIPNTPSKNCRVRISDVSNSGINAISWHSVFTIYPAPSDPCNGVKSMNYGGRIYNTVAIGGLCWFKENLNIGTMIDSLKNQTNNGIVEKYCYNNDTANCNKFGGLYQWNEAMQYSTEIDPQGICPPNWFIPTQEEIMGLLGGSVNYDSYALRDVTAGGTNTSGFSALLSGYRLTDGSFNSLGYSTGFWSSSQYYNNTSFEVTLIINDIHMPVNYDPVSRGFSVRCLHDYMAVPVELTSFTGIVTNNYIKLNWNTVTEINTSSFEIEKKASNNNSWQKIASVKASGNSTITKQYSYIDKNVNSGKYNYRLKMIDLDGTFKYSNIVTAEIAVPAKFELSNAYPNPWNPTTTIRYQVPTNILVTIKVFDVLGREVSTLVNEIKPAGSYEVTFTAKELSSGTYYYQMKAGNYIETKKLTLLK